MGRVPTANLQPPYLLQPSMRRLPRLKLVFWLCWLKSLIWVVAFLIAISIHYLAHVFQKFVLTVTRIVIVVKSVIYQIYIGSQDTNYCRTWLFVTTIALDSTRILTKRLIAEQDGGLIVNWFSSVFFFRRLKGFFFLLSLWSFQPQTSIFRILIRD